jgi:hypothetical protein
MPLPPIINRLFLASYVILILTFIFSMINLGEFSLYIVPVGCLLTAIYHITLVTLSKRKEETHNSRLRPPIQEVYAQMNVYPSYTINVANCTITFLLAIMWSASSWLPIFCVIVDKIDLGPRYRIPPMFEGALGYCESFILFALFGLFVHHRKHQLRNKEFIRMEN